MTEIGRRLQAARQRAGLSQTQVAERLGLTRAHVSHVEGGHRNLTITTMGAFARAIGCTLTVILTPQDRLTGKKGA